MNPRQKHTRLVCNCRHCSAVCRAAPGFLIPGDIDRITDQYADLSDVAPEKHADVRLLWQCDHFRWSADEGTIIPRQHDDGRCVFLGPEGECLIHDVAPYGCSHVNRCGDPREQGERIKAGLLAIEEDALENGPYNQLLEHLASREAFQARPLDERLANYGDEIHRQP